MPRVLRVLLFFLLSTCCFGGNIVYLRVHRGVVEERLNTPPATGLERLHKLRAQFEAAGCTRGHLSEQAIPRQDLPNVMCNLPGKEPGTIVIGAPIDFDAVGTADESQWATLVLLPLLAESVGAVQHRLSLTFVAFTGHNHGLRGSSEYVKQLTESQRSGIRAMISLEDIGRTPPVYALAQEDLRLANWLTLSSNVLRLGSMPMEITARSVDAPLINNRPVFNPDEYLLDATAFQHAHVPAIALRSAPLSMVPAMRQAGAWQGYSSGKFFDLDIYEQTYNQLCVYLLYLDSNLGTSHSSPPGTEVAAAPVKPSPTTAETLTASGAGTVKTPAAGQGLATVASAAIPSSVPASPTAQQPTGIPPDVPVFHAQAKLVVIDVSITDAKGAPVKGLQAGDFTLLENGKPQVVRVFEAHSSSGSAASGSTAPQNSLPAGTFSNRMTPASADAPLSIFLFDLLNTPPNDQAYARAQMLQFLKTVPKGKHLALFVLGTHLQMVQGFTDDSEGLVKTAEKVMRQASPLLTTQVQQQQDQGFIEETARYAQPHVPDAAGQSIMQINAAEANPTAPGFRTQRTATSATQEGIRTDQRTTMTLEAMEAIARAVSAYPGRKNLVWLSGSFEIRLRPFDNTFGSIASVSSQAAVPVSNLATNFSYQNEIRRVTTVMATARIAIYPIDVRGIQTGGVEIGVGTDQSRDMVNSPISDAYTDVLSSQSGTRFNERASMLELADQTGGHLYIENDVRGSIARSLEEGSNYYTLAYTPEKSSNDSFRRVEIKLNRPSVKLAYRPGYYPTQPQDSVKQSGAQMLAAAMQPGLPQSTMLLVTAKVLPPDATSKSLRIDYSIDLSGLDFTDTTDDRKRALLDCMAVALDGHGQIAGQIANTMDASLPPKEYQAMQQTGLPLHQELTLPPGTYDLRLGVLDRASQKIGTVDVPVVIAAKLP